MKYFLILLSVTLVAGCSVRDIVTMDTATTQQFDLNDPDKDGVIVARERCEGTVKGAEVDNYGCSTVKSVDSKKQLEILFENNSAYINPAYYAQIETIAKLLQQNPDSKVVIEGHCSNRGSYEMNLLLSQNRAKAVTEVLNETFGIEADRLSAVGYSYDQLIDTSGTPEAENRNRRVIANVQGSDSMTNLKWHIYTVDEDTE